MWEFEQATAHEAVVMHVGCDAVTTVMSPDGCCMIQVQAYDDHFKAVNTFRFIGYLLDQVGHPCVTLWDPQEPRKWMYGQYEKNICAGSFVTAAP